MRVQMWTSVEERILCVTSTLTVTTCLAPIAVSVMTATTATEGTVNVCSHGYRTNFFKIKSLQSD